MTTEGQIRAGLLAASALTTLVSTRIAAGSVPQNKTYPQVTFERIDTQYEYSHDGESGLRWSRFAFKGWSQDKDEASRIGDALETAFRSFDLTQEPASPEPALTMSPNRLLNRFADEFTDTEPHVFRVQIDVKIWHRANS